MTVAIVTTYASKKPAGLERYLLDLLRALDAIEDITFIVYTKRGSDLGAILKQEGITNIAVHEIGFGKLWKDIGIYSAPKADAYIFNGPRVPLFFSPKKYTTIVYDFAYKMVPVSGIKDKMKRWFLDWISARAFARSKKIIAISDATGDDIVNHFGTDRKKIETIYPGFRHMCAIQADPVARINTPFFMFIGSVKHRKNVHGIIAAYASLCKQGDVTEDLIIAGKLHHESAYGKKLIALVKEGNIEDRVHFLGHVTDANVSWLYQNATALVFPSLIEGFGFPIVEAMDCGLPVITSQGSCLGEVAGDAAVLVDEHDPADIARGMASCMDEHMREVYREKGFAHAQQYSWERSATEFGELLGEL